MQWLVYVHNNGAPGSGSDSGVVLADAPSVPSGREPATFARVWVDHLADDTATEIRRVLGQLFTDYPPMDGVPGTHMTEMASIEVCTGPGFETRQAIEHALVAALQAAKASAA